MPVLSAVMRGTSALLRFQRCPLHHQRALHTSLLRLLPKTVPYILTDIGEGIVEVVVKEWYVKEGDKVAQFDPVCEVQSDKASVTITSRFDGEVGKMYYAVDDMAKVGSALLDIVVADDQEDTTGVSGSEKSQDTAPVPQPSRTSDIVEEDKYFQDKALATPAVRRIARENKIDLKNVQATGKNGRILKEDILLHVGLKGPVTDSPREEENIRSGDTKLQAEDWTEPIVGVKKAMFKTMVQAWTIPHFTYADEVDVSSFASLKPELQRLEKSTGVKITFLPFLLKATSQALLKYPRLNAEADEPKLTIRGSHNLGVAMDTPLGLLVPNIKNIQNLSVPEIARELNRLQGLGKDGRLGPADLSGGTLTLSNIGAIGGTVATPVLLPPQIVIGAIGKIQKLPRFNENGDIIVADILTVSWSADHRVVDGATLARFSNLFKVYIASPQLLLHL